jgi:hypothetical protein
MGEMKNAALYESDGNYYLYMSGGETRQIALPTNLELFISILQEYYIDILWVMPQTQLSQRITWADFDRIDPERYTVFGSRKSGKPTFVSMQKGKSRLEKKVYLAFPEHAEWTSEDQGKWYLPAPYTLGLTINYLRREFDLDPMWGPGNMGMKVLKRIFAKEKWEIENLILTDHIESILNQTVARPVWRKYGGLSSDQAQRKYLHAYDKNSQYLGAAQSVYLGNGQPEEAGPEDFNIGAVGLWEYRLVDVSDSVFDGYDLPCPLSLARPWASTTMLQAARDLNIEFEILGGIVWKQQPRKYLEKWAKEMRKHRENLRNESLYTDEIARENAEGTAKMSANSLMGRLATPGKSGELCRKDWNDLIVEQAIANQAYTFNKLQRDYGIKPVLICTDSWWITSDEPDPAKAIPDILKYQHEQRGYKHIGTVPMTPEIIDAFTTELPEDINAMLKKMREVCHA